MKLFELYNLLSGIGKPNVKSHKIADFVFLPYIYFILAFAALECMKRYLETLCVESRQLPCLPHDPLIWVKLGS